MVQRASLFPDRGQLDPLQAFQQAAAFHAQGRLREAERLYEVVLSAEDRHFDSIYRLGLIRLQQNRFDDAARLFRRAIKIEKDSTDAQFHLAVALTGLGRIEEALARYEKVLALKPHFPEAYNNLGHTLQMLDRHQEAAAQYEKALAINPAYAEARNNLGNALQMLGHSKAAIAQYEKALAIRPNYPEAHINLGNVLATLGDHETVIANYRKALALRPTNTGAHHSLANALAALGRHEEAVVHYEYALAISPRDTDVRFKLGDTFRERGYYDKALKQFDDVLAIRPDNSEGLIARANILARLGQNAEAVEVFEDLVRRGAHTIHVLLALASMPASLVGVDLLTELGKMVRHEGGDDAEFENFAAFIRAAALDKAGRYSEAWQCLAAANATVFAAAQEEFAKAVTQERATLARLCQRSSRTLPHGKDGGQPISLFILGPSRSGKSAMEALVGTLDGVTRGYENPSVKDAVSRTSRAAELPASTLLEHLPETLYSLIRDKYIDELGARARSARVFTSTNPGRIQDADLMAAVLPDVRFILMKRDLQDNLLRIYQRRYRTGNNLYSYDLKAARDHIVWYHQMIELLAERLPDIVRVIQYEDMVDDPTAALRVAAELCGLPMSEGPLPAIADDRGCAAPYRQFLTAELHD